MGKKKRSISFIYLIGMALTAIGFCLPMFALIVKNPFNGKVSVTLRHNGFDFIQFGDNFGWITIAAICIFVGAVLGILFCLLKVKGASTLKLIALLVSVAGGIILLVVYNDNWLSKLIGEGFWKHAYVGTYMILAGWAVSLIGWITNK